MAKPRSSPARAAKPRPSNTEAFSLAWEQLTRETAENDRLQYASDAAAAAVERHFQGAYCPASDRAQTFAVEILRPYAKGPKAGLVIGDTLLLNPDHSAIVSWRGAIVVPLSVIEGLDSEGTRR